MNATASTIPVERIFGVAPKAQWATVQRATLATTIQDRLTPPRAMQSSQSSIEKDLRSMWGIEKARHQTMSAGQADRNWLARAQERLSQIALEPSRVQPEPAVIESVATLLRLLFLLNMKPQRIVATAEGGVSLWFIRERYRAMLEIPNDEPTVAVLAETKEGYPPQISEISLMRSYSEILPAMTRLLGSLNV